MLALECLPVAKRLCAPIVLSFVTCAITVFLSPAHADDYAHVARLAKAGQFQEVIAASNLFLMTKPNDPQMRLLKGVSQNALGSVLEATLTFLHLTEDYPELAEPYNNLAVIYTQNGQIDKARLALEMALSLSPDYLEAQENLGDVYAKLASQSYARVLQLAPSRLTVATKLQLMKQLFLKDQ